MQTSPRPLFHAMLKTIVQDIPSEETDAWPVHLGAIDLGTDDRMVYLGASVSPTGAMYVHHEIAGQRDSLRELIYRVGQVAAPPPFFVAIGPDGIQRNLIDHDTPAACLRRHGLDPLVTRESVRNGLAILTRLMIPTLHREALAIHPRCYHLRWALHNYAIGSQANDVSPATIKQATHAVDTLRYLAVGSQVAKAQNVVVDRAQTAR